MWNFLSYFHTGMSTSMFPLCHILLALEPCEWSDLVTRNIAFGFSLFEEKKKRQDTGFPHPTPIYHTYISFGGRNFPLIKDDFISKEHSFIY